MTINLQVPKDRLGEACEELESVLDQLVRIDMSGSKTGSCMLIV